TVVSTGVPSTSSSRMISKRKGLSLRPVILLKENYSMAGPRADGSRSTWEQPSAPHTYSLAKEKVRSSKYHLDPADTFRMRPTGTGCVRSVTVETIGSDERRPRGPDRPHRPHERAAAPHARRGGEDALHPRALRRRRAAVRGGGAARGRDGGPPGVRPRRRRTHRRAHRPGPLHLRGQPPAPRLLVRRRPAPHPHGRAAVHRRTPGRQSPPRQPQRQQPEIGRAH